MAADTEYVLVTEYFYPDTASTGQLMTDLATGLQERGLEMTVYTGQPNYHSGDLDKQPHQSHHEGVFVKRIRAPQVRQSSLPRRLFNWIIFTAWMFVVLLFSRSESEREVIFVSNPPFLPIAMWLVCWVRDWQYTFIVYDVYPDMAIAPGHLSESGIIARTWRLLQKRVFTDATNIVTLGPAMRQRVIDYTGGEVNTDKIRIIHNWEDPEFITPQEKSDNPFARKHGLDDCFCVLYSGNIGDNHDLTTLIRAAKRFEDIPVKVVIIGDGDRKQESVELATELRLESDTIEFFPFQPLKNLPNTLTCGNISVVSISNGMKGVCVSSKLYTSLAAGTPVLVISEGGDDEARIIEAGDAGIHVEQGEVEEVVNAIETWRTNKERRVEQGRNARKLFEENFTKERSIDRYYRLLDDDQECQRIEDGITVP